MSIEDNKRRTNKNKLKKIKNKKKNKKKSIIMKILLVLFLLGLLFISYLGSIFYSSYKDITDVSKVTFWKSNSSVDIYDRNDDFINSLSSFNTTFVPLCKDDSTTCLKDDNFNISHYYIDALIDTEDNNFRTNNAVDFFGLVKATLVSIFTSNDRGGSTLTMQLGKLIYMENWVFLPWDNDKKETTTDPKFFPRKHYEPLRYKFTQMGYAMKINQMFSKEEILENLVNLMNFDNSVYGIENASQYYFNTSADKLNLVEAATLAGITNLPATYDPYVHPEASEKRRNIVLLSMYKQKSITKEEYDKAIATPTSKYLQKHVPTKHGANAENTGFVDLVYRELFDIFGSDFDPSVAGLKIYTSMDPDLQKATYDTQNDDSIYPYDKLQSGVATIDTQNGEVLAIGPRYGEASLLGTNYAINNQRQPGSTSKPIVDYGPALEFLHWSTAHKIVDSPVNYSNGGPKINNADNEYKGDLSIQAALSLSRNTTAVKTFQEVVKAVGLNKINDFVAGLGISDSDINDFNESYAIGGWKYGSTPLEMAAAYAAFGNGGTYNEPHAITKIVISKNSPYYEKYGSTFIPKYESHKAMSPETAFMMTDMLSTNKPEAEWLSRYKLNPAIPNVSAKTGTSNWSANSYGIPDGNSRDNWDIGYTPEITSALWVGYPSKEEQKGAYIPQSIYTDQIMFNSIMSAAYYSSSPYLHDNQYNKPNTLYYETLEPEKWPLTRSKDKKAKKYLFFKNSPEAKNIKDNFEDEKAEPPKVTSNLTDNSIQLKWDYSGDYRSTSTWTIYVDHKQYKNINQLSINIPFGYLTKNACVASHTIGVVLNEKNPDGKVRHTKKVDIPLKIPDITYCLPFDDIPDIPDIPNSKI